MKSQISTFARALMAGSCLFAASCAGAQETVEPVSISALADRDARDEIIYFVMPDRFG